MARVQLANARLTLDQAPGQSSPLVQPGAAFAPSNEARLTGVQARRKTLVKMPLTGAIEVLQEL